MPFCSLKKTVLTNSFYPFVTEDKPPPLWTKHDVEVRFSTAMAKAFQFHRNTSESFKFT
jgi:hypothetical protein